MDRLNFLDEVLRLDGRGDYINQASCAGQGCAAEDPCFRCTDCFYPCLYCKECVVALHQCLPLHRVEMWDGASASFRRQKLKELGVRIQLGHAWGSEPCSTPSQAAGDDFVIVGPHIIVEVGLDYCNCGQAEPKPIQLLRGRLYPATGTNPRSAATFTALRRFDHMSLESKCSAYEFYNSLAHETNNTGLELSRDRYDEFLRMTRQWQDIQLLKRAGRGHDPADDRIAATKPGECALLCPACPQPGKNLSEGWQNVPFEKAFIYALYIALDANFRLKRRDVSREKKDPGLHTGFAFFWDVPQYMAHLEKFWDQKQERSTCVAHDAVDKPDRESLGTASSGIGTVDCARHNMKRPNGVGDLQKGERYLNMDYLFFMSLGGTPLQRLYVSYDIACQWHKNIWERMKAFAEYEGIEIKQGTKILVFLVPKFHLPAHIELCNILFSFNLTPFVGRTDGEAPERGWADANRLANSTSISGPGAHRDTLDIHFQYWNWKKTVGLGTTLLERVQKNVPLMLEAQAAWVDIEVSFEPSVIKTWTAMAVAWEANPKKPNPFQSTLTHEGLREVRRNQAVEAAEDVANLRVRGDMHETEMLSMGLQLEGEQCGKRRIERETKLRRKIDTWMTVQQLFIPEVTLLREEEDAARKRVAATQAVPGMRAQDMQLWLPSAIGKRVRCDETLLTYEYDLRKGQVFEALDGMRGLLLVRTREYLYKDDQIHGVKAKGRAATRIKGIQARLDLAADEYRAGYAALVSLGSVLKKVEWKTHLKVLKAGDAAARQEQQRAEERMPLSWIWIAQAGDGNQKDVVHNEFFRIEWAKARAKSMRFSEEIDLLEEEMARTLRFMRWCARWWMGLVGLRAAVQDEASREGHAAYARKQSTYMSGIADRFQEMWKDVAQYIELVRAGYSSTEPDDDAVEEESDEESDEEGDAGWLSA
ncbi:hypothetical protein B0H19DRAFT_969948 [Mycena capillaripes]|nr:hypothetical protein B0H19DRAFT_969948 [Mycena capillaripes]